LEAAIGNLILSICIHIFINLSLNYFYIYRGSTIAKIIGNNVLNNQKFDQTVKMYVYEEMVNGRKLTEIINNDHENIKYLPGHKLPANVVCVFFYLENKKFHNENFNHF
jgi:hypothetical protein